MIKVSVFYPTGSGDDTFDMEYYRTTHMPMVRRLCGDACKGIAAEKGLSGGAPGSPATYVAIGELLFESVESFGAAFGPVARDINADISNYTKITPIIQISEITL